MIKLEESTIDITIAPVPKGWAFTISDSNNTESQPSTSDCISFGVSKEEVMSYHGAHDQNGTVVQPKFHKIIVDGSSDPDNDFSFTVQCNGKKLFHIEKPKKRLVCQMVYKPAEYKIEDGNKICLTTASAFVTTDGSKNVSLI